MLFIVGLIKDKPIKIKPDNCVPEKADTLKHNDVQ